ncbi:hypothetical protein NHX12_019197 [Muraenolepis orangiensis]|uniref:Uncharacterized protein n=1 Tax=Muraenolepis orangiensis TaxID=630683 RepID=A0A9Q0IWE1_9TELE|nr:hypothetical protein NHX12_019197 [Muraenolepis orangiensis]
MKKGYLSVNSLKILQGHPGAGGYATHDNITVEELSEKKSSIDSQKVFCVGGTCNMNTPDMMFQLFHSQVVLDRRLVYREIQVLSELGPVFWVESIHPFAAGDLMEM